MRLLPMPLLALLLAVPGAAQIQPPNEAGVAMGHVHLNVRDAEQHRKIWMEHFDAAPLAREGLTGVRMPGFLVLFREQEPTGGSEGTAMDHFGLKVRSTADTVAAWRAAGMEAPREFNGAEGFPNAYLMAPDGVKLEIQEDTSLDVKAIGHHMHFTSPGHLELREWYAETFGSGLTKRGRLDTGDVPGANLTFASTRNPPSGGTRGTALDHIGFEVKNLEAFCKQLEAKGIKLDVPYRQVERLGIALAFFTDPSGVYIELTEGLDQY